MIKKDDIANIPISSYIFVGLSFLTTPIGGVLIGFICGLASAFVTKHASHLTNNLKPMLVLMFAVLAYVLVADTLSRVKRMNKV